MNLDLQLAQLETAQLVRRADGNDPSFQFKHAQTILQQGMNNG